VVAKWEGQLGEPLADDAEVARAGHAAAKT
jgi:hypothetical protein